MIFEQLFQESNTSDFDRHLDTSAEFGLSDKLQDFRLGLTLNNVKKLGNLERKLKNHDPKNETVKPNALLRRFALNGEPVDSGKELVKAYQTHLEIYECFLDEFRQFIKEASRFANDPNGDQRLDFDKLWSKTKSKWKDLGDKTLSEREYSIISVVGLNARKRKIAIFVSNKRKLTTPKAFDNNASFDELVKLYQRGFTLVKEYQAIQEEGGLCVKELFKAYGSRASFKRRLALDDRYLNLFSPYGNCYDQLSKTTIALGEFLLRY